MFLDDLVVGFVPNPGENCVPGAQPVLFDLDLTPATASNNVGESHEVTAKLLDAATSAPIANATIDFDVTGANTTSGSGVTDANGEATFSYTGTAAGDDTISASYDADASPPAEATASATAEWLNNPPTAEANGPYLTAVNVR